MCGDIDPGGILRREPAPDLSALITRPQTEDPLGAPEPNSPDRRGNGARLRAT